MNSITEEMRSIIEKNLPAATAGAMSDFITEAEDTKRDLEVALNAHGRLEKELKQEGIAYEKLKASLTVANARLKSHMDLAVREEAVSDRERNMKLEIVEVRLAAAEDRNHKIQGLVEKVFGHPNVTVSTYKSKPRMSESSNGCTPYEIGQETETESTTTTPGKS